KGDPVDSFAASEQLEDRMLLAAAVDYGDYFWANGQQIPLLRVTDETTAARAHSTPAAFTGPRARRQDPLRSVDPSATVFAIDGSQSTLELTREVYVSLSFGRPDTFFSPARGFSGYQRVAGTTSDYVATVSAGAAASLIAANALHGLAGVAFAHPNFLVQGSLAANDLLLSSQWHLNNAGQSGGTVDADVDAFEAWEITTGSSNIVV